MVDAKNMGVLPAAVPNLGKDVQWDERQVYPFVRNLLKVAGELVQTEANLNGSTTRMGRLEALPLSTIDLRERTIVNGVMRYPMAMIHQSMHQLVEGRRTSNIYESFWWLCFLTSTSLRLDSDWRTAVRSSQRWIRCCWMDLCQQHFKLARQKPRQRCALIHPRIALMTLWPILVIWMLYIPMAACDSLDGGGLEILKGWK